MGPAWLRALALSGRRVTAPLPRSSGSGPFAAGRRGPNAAVTVRRDRCPMQAEQERSGVCIVRVIRQATGGLMITLVERRDVENASSQAQRTVTDVAQAVDAVRAFILDVARPAAG